MQSSQIDANDANGWHYAINQSKSPINKSVDSTTTTTTTMQAARPTERIDEHLIKSPKTNTLEFMRMTKLEKTYKENKQKILNVGENIKGQRTFKLNANNSGVFC